MGVWDRMTGKEGISGFVDPFGTGVGDMFEKGSATQTLEPMKEKFQMELGTKLSDIYKKALASYKPGADYSSLSKLMTPSTQEQQGLGLLDKYIKGDTKPTGVMGQAEGVLSKTLGGGYDPFESKYYESLRRNVEKERAQSMKKLDQMISKGGLGGSSFRAGRIADTQLESFSKISDIIAGLQESERMNQLNAVTGAQNFSNTAEGQIQKKLSTIMDIGSLPRQLENVGYEDFLRKQQEGQNVSQSAQSLFQYNMPYGKKSLTYGTPSVFDELLGYAGDIASIVGAFKGGGQPNQDIGTRGTSTPSEAARSIAPTVGGTTGGLNQQPKLSSISLRAMQPSQFNQYWNQYS